jgi:hypothetical protein
MAATPSAGIEFEVKGIEDILAKMKAMEHTMGSEAGKIVEETLEGMHKQADPLTPYRTGNLRSHNKTRITESGMARVSGELYNDCSYAPYVFFGTYKMKGRDWMTAPMLWGEKYMASRIAQIKLGE